MKELIGLIMILAADKEPPREPVDFFCNKSDSVVQYVQAQAHEASPTVPEDCGWFKDDYGFNAFGTYTLITEIPLSNESLFRVDFGNGIRVYTYR